MTDDLPPDPFAKKEGLQGLRATLEAMRETVEAMPLSEMPFGVREPLLEDAAELRRLRFFKVAAVIEEIAPTFSSEFDPRFWAKGTSGSFESWLRHRRRLARLRAERRQKALTVAVSD